MALGQKDQLKVVSLCTLLVEGLLGGLLPVFVRALRREGPALESAHGFSGGVILSIAVLHMLVDAIDAQADATSLTYPFWAIFTSIGLLILVFVEYIVVPSASDRSKDVLDSLRQPLLARAALSLHWFLASVTKCWTTAKQGASANDAPNDLVSVLLHSGDGSFSLRARTGTSQKTHYHVPNIHYI
jgi:hypothetical protein